MDSECQNPPPPSQLALRRHPSKVGAVCSNTARTDLCGGRRVTGVPTATKSTLLMKSLFRDPAKEAANERVSDSDRVSGRRRVGSVRVRSYQGLVRAKAGVQTSSGDRGIYRGNKRRAPGSCQAR